MKNIRYILALAFVLFLLKAQSQTEAEQKVFWKKVRQEIPEFKKVFKKYKKYRFEIVYTRVVNDPLKGRTFQRFYFGDHDTYFYPASTVKFPMALKTFQKLNKCTENKLINTNDVSIRMADSVFCGYVNKSNSSNLYLRVTDSISISHAAAMGGIRPELFLRINGINISVDAKQTDLEFSSKINGEYQSFKKIPPFHPIKLTPTPFPVSVYQMMNDMLLYSNNNWFNWLFEFAVNEKPVISKPGIDIHKRLMLCSHADSLVTRKTFLHEQGSDSLHPMGGENISYEHHHLFKKGYVVGKKYYDGNNQLISHGRDFSYHNQLRLDALQDHLIELIYPGYLPQGTAYEITQEQRIQLIQWMGMNPREDKVVTDSSYLHVPDDFTNFLYTGQTHESIPENLRIVNVIGQAYGFVTDCAYIADEDKKVEFFLAARIYVNKDGVLNDDKYEYETIAYPLMQKLGRVIFQHEQADQRDWGVLPWVFQIFR